MHNHTMLLNKGGRGGCSQVDQPRAGSIPVVRPSINGYSMGGCLILLQLQGWLIAENPFLQRIL